jgi:hypothetical protein
VLALLRTYTDRYGAEDASGLGELFTPDAVRHNDGDRPEDREQAVETYQEQFDGLNDPVYTLEGVRIATAPGRATVRARYAITSSRGTTRGAITYYLVERGDGLAIDRLEIVPDDSPRAASGAAISLTAFETPRDLDAEVPAAYCETRGDALYCWTPNDGYTFELVERQGFDRVLDDAANRGRDPGGYRTLEFGQSVRVGSFTCTSSAADLTCVDSGGRGFELPRYRGLPRAVG